MPAGAGTNDRSNVASSFTIVKGSMIPETYEVLARWDHGATKKENLDRLRDQNFIGAASDTWLRDVAKVLNRRLDPSGRDRPLVVLASGGCPLEEWKPILLWHMTRDEFLVRDFLVNWLFPAFADGVFRVRPEDVHDHLRTVADRGGETEHGWSDATLARVATGLLRLASDFGLLVGAQVKEFAGYHLPERSLLYLLRAVLEQEEGSPRRLVASTDWRMYLMTQADLERELLRLHQFQKLDYQVAGSLVQLSFPGGGPLGYAQEMVA